MTYPSSQGPYGPRPGYPAPAWQQPGGYRPPPRKNRTALIVSVVAVVLVVVGAVAVTGFVAPGFFLSENEPSGLAPQTPPSTPASPSIARPVPGGGSGPPTTQAADPLPRIAAVLDEFVEAINSGDKEKATQLTCPRLRDRSVADEFIDGNAKIRLSAGGAFISRGKGFSFYRGTVNGKRVGAGMLVLGDEVKGKWCHAGLSFIDLPR